MESVVDVSNFSWDEIEEMRSALCEAAVNDAVNSGTLYDIFMEGYDGYADLSHEEVLLQYKDRFQEVSDGY